MGYGARSLRFCRGPIGLNVAIGHSPHPIGSMYGIFTYMKTIKINQMQVWV